MALAGHGFGEGGAALPPCRRSSDIRAELDACRRPARAYEVPVAALTAAAPVPATALAGAAPVPPPFRPPKRVGPSLGTMSTTRQLQDLLGRTSSRAQSAALSSGLEALLAHPSRGCRPPAQTALLAGIGATPPGDGAVGAPLFGGTGSPALVDPCSPGAGSPLQLPPLQPDAAQPDDDDAEAWFGGLPDLGHDAVAAAGPTWLAGRVAAAAEPLSDPRPRCADARRLPSFVAASGSAPRAAAAPGAVGSAFPKPPQREAAPRSIEPRHRPFSTARLLRAVMTNTSDRTQSAAAPGGFGYGIGSSGGDFGTGNNPCKYTRERSAVAEQMDGVLFGGPLLRQDGGEGAPPSPVQPAPATSVAEPAVRSAAEVHSPGSAAVPAEDSDSVGSLSWGADCGQQPSTPRAQIVPSIPSPPARGPAAVAQCSPPVAAPTAADAPPPAASAPGDTQNAEAALVAMGIDPPKLRPPRRLSPPPKRRRQGSADLWAPESLDADQRQAAEAPVGPATLVSAGAGAGKTRTLVARILHLLRLGAQPSSVVGFTFSRRAASEMRGRMQSALQATGDGRSGAVSLMTFHAAALMLLRRTPAAAGLPPHFSVLDRRGQMDVMRSLECEDGAQKALRWVQRNKSRGRTPPAAPSNDVQRLWVAYEQRLAEAGALDFNDIIPRCLSMLQADEQLLGRVRATYQHCLVDECQDMNERQLSFVTLLFPPGGSNGPFCVGDSQQAIYGFRGSVRDVFSRLRSAYRDHVAVNLMRNYRCPGTVVAAAEAVLQRVACVQVAMKGGEPVQLHRFRSPEDEQRWVVAAVAQLCSSGVRPGDVAVLCRRREGVLPAFEAELRRSGISFCSARSIELDDRVVAQDLVDYLRVVAGADSTAFARVLNVPKRQLGPAACDYLAAISRLYKCESQLDAALRAKDAGFPAIEGAAGKPLKLSRKQAAALAGLVSLVLQLRSAAEGCTVTAVLRRLVEELNYGAFAERRQEEARRRRPGFGAEAEDARLGMDALDALLKESERFDAEAAVGSAPAAARLLAFVDAASTCALDAGADSGRLCLSTIHASKALEWPHVFLVRCNEGVCPARPPANVPPDVLAAELAEERRCMYVGMTRAVGALRLTCVDDGAELRPSSFLSGLPEADVVSTDHPQSS